VANTLELFWGGAVGFIEWLGSTVSPARKIRDNESATKCNEERPWERKIVEIMRGPNMEMMAQQHRNRHPNPRQTREPLESLAAIVGEYGGNGRRNQPSGAREVQKGNRGKGLGRETLHGPN
jgi:hypothetical protein